MTNSLQALNPELAAQWHPAKNKGLTPDQVLSGSNKKVWWKCPKGPNHEWPASPGTRTGLGTGCPFCNSGWTIDNLRRFVSSIRTSLEALTPAQLYAIFQQAGVFDSRNRALALQIASGRMSVSEVDRWLVAAEEGDLERSTTRPAPGDELETGLVEISDVPIDQLGDPSLFDEAELPVVETADVLQALDAVHIISSDEATAEFMVASSTALLWKHAYSDQIAARAQAESHAGGDYSERVSKTFLAELSAAVSLKIPDGYEFRVEGKATPPNLMQRHVASQVVLRRRVGNWSGTGAGKTLSAILASRLINAELTVICCPNSVVEGWRDKIIEAFPDSDVQTKSFEPAWSSVPGKPHRYLVMNYEQFQQRDSPLKVRDFLKSNEIDFVVIDEVHFTKQRVAENLSRRRELLTALVSYAAEQNPGLCVLGMSSTPVINNLKEGRSLVEIITGLSHGELEDRPTVSNCMRLHQALVRLGSRWVPDYDIEYEQVERPVDCTDYLDEIRQLGARGSPLALEQVLTRARLPVILDNVRPKTLIYTHYVTGIAGLLHDAIAAAGWRVGFFIGEEKSGLDAFIDGELDVLIASSAIATGVDRLQEVCHRMIINVLPWTAAEFDQLKGRLYRQGQVSEKITTVIPMSYATIGGERWSWCDSKMNRLRFKRSIADAAVDGVVPEGHLRSPAQAYQDLMAWLGRLDRGELSEVQRIPIVVPLPDDDPEEVRTRYRRYGDFSQINNRWNGSSSDLLHQRLANTPEEWAHYHTLYREARKDWAVVPYEEVIRWCEQREGYVIGDFGCGEAELAQAVSDRHTVYSFDHVAINEDVIACDMAHVPLEDSALDVAVFSLSLMGHNLADYLLEASRVLRIDGQIHIYEATSRFKDRDGFVKSLRRFGFENVEVTDRWKFTHISAIKTREPDADATIDL